MSIDSSHHPTSLTSTTHESKVAGSRRDRTDESTTRLRLSAYDPRAVGGRQLVRLSLPTEFASEVDELELRVRCDLLPLKVSQYRFIRALNREWQAVLLSFSSRDKEHGQYALELELRAYASCTKATTSATERTISRRWQCHSILFLPRSDASLSEIHQVFLSSQKQVRVLAEDGSIARLQHLASSSNQLQVDVVARDGAVAHVQLDPHHSGAIQESRPGYLAWDEALVELAVAPLNSPPLPTANNAQTSIADSTPEKVSTHGTNSTYNIAALNHTIRSEVIPTRLDISHRIRHHRLHLSAADSWQFGRDPASQLIEKSNYIVLDHPRISGVHATIQLRDGDFLLCDHSRFGISVNGHRLKKDSPITLNSGDVIDFCTSFPEQLVWQVVLTRRAENGKSVCLLRCQQEYGTFEHLCLVHANCLSPSTLEAIDQLCAEAYAIPNTTAYASTLPPSAVLRGKEDRDWRIEYENNKQST